MGLDMNVQEAWAEGVTGKGTVVTILDDGLETDHPDIRRNYVSALISLPWRYDPRPPFPTSQLFFLIFLMGFSVVFFF
jgi:subtilisin family serine protease